MNFNVVLTGPRRVTQCETHCHTADEAEVTEIMKRDGWTLGTRDPKNLGGQHFVDLHWSRNRETIEKENGRLWFLLRNKSKSA